MKYTFFFFFFQAEDGIRDIGRDWSSDVCSSDLRGGGCSEHGGGLKGTSTYIGLRDDGIAIVAFFNKDATGDFQWSGSKQNRDDVLHSVADGIGTWPANDLFPSVMTAPLTPGPEKLSVFISASDKLIRDASWERNVANRWLGWWRIREGSAPAG